MGCGGHRLPYHCRRILQPQDHRCGLRSAAASASPIARWALCAPGTIPTKPLRRLGGSGYHHRWCRWRPPYGPLGANPWGWTRAIATVGRMVAALRRIGFDYVFDTDFAADLTIMEEASEFLERFKHTGALQIPHVHLLLPGLGAVPQIPIPGYGGPAVYRPNRPSRCSAPSPRRIMPTCWGWMPSKIFCISIMPCVAKKRNAPCPPWPMPARARMWTWC